ncbi:superinfection immunity protein [Caldalkalibacillus thermarum TA2.A1]|uniref:Superinfection immunity protein n=1 Tax=Caldalkalibacillus thermarum (strain TA2.A1) TaxID=986075 RepID=A0A8X8I9X7_CALTT|nr:superinfection immunity protein [Caldalkalibacillus thermarum]QZT33716.1 superinfection immunity protein [Caldalkalibacillus thermarum TA2.A1]
MSGELVVYFWFFLYFVPAIVALVRKHHNKMAIIALNVLLGWTLLGWVGALVWSLTRVEGQKDASV